MSDEVKDLMMRLLCKDPKFRLGSISGIKEILAHPWFKGIKSKDVLDKKMEPPYKPNPIKFNFDEKEFKKGELEFLKQFEAL